MEQVSRVGARGQFVAVDPSSRVGARGEPVVGELRAEFRYSIVTTAPVLVRLEFRICIYLFCSLK